MAESFVMLRVIGSPFPEDFATNTLGYRPPIAFYSSLSPAPSITITRDPVQLSAFLLLPYLLLSLSLIRRAKLF